MSSNREYTVGDFWLAKEPKSGRYHVHWYDPNSRRGKRFSTGQTDFQLAKEIITAHHLKQLKPEQVSKLTVDHVALKYWEDKGKHTIASDTQRVALDKLTRFLADKHPNLLAESWTRNITAEFIDWIRANADRGTISDNSINRMIDIVRAAFRHCMDRPPVIKGIEGVQARGGRKKPTLSIEQVRDLFRYAFETEERHHLQCYLMAAFTTLARPEAILDISLSPEREQVEWDYRLLHLLPEGKAQTKKVRPTVPINDYLLPYLQAAQSHTSGYLCEYKGKPMAGIRMTWNRAKQALGWPMVRDWDAKMIRHTMSKWLRAQGVPWEELQGQLGHRILGITEEYAEYTPNYLGKVQAEITRFLDEIFQGQEYGCSPIAPRLEKRVVSIKSAK